MEKLNRQRKAVIFLIFCLSGFSALVYEVLWTKHLSLAFGTTMTAVSIVAATFMAGLAIGGYLLGRFADRDTNLLKIYALLELGIALFALLFPPTLKVVSSLHVWLVNLLPNHELFNHSMHFGLAAVLLLPPTVCMGGTFPVMCRFFARNKSGGQIGRLYAINTLGAAIGAFLCGYFLIPELGMFATNLGAVGLNLLAAIVSWHFSKSARKATADNCVAQTSISQTSISVKKRPILTATALIGFLTLAYEILWTRVFMLFLGNTSYAFSMMLSSFLVSIAFGGALYARLVKPQLNERKLFVRLTFFMGLSILCTVPFYDQLAYLFQWVHDIALDNWGLLTLLSGLIVFLVICLPIIISGALLPAAIAILDPGEHRTGEGVGRVVLCNTLGAVLGSLVTAFFLIPNLGSQASFQLLAVVNLILSTVLALIYYAPSPMRYARIALVSTAGLALAYLSPAWDQGLINSGVYIYAARYRQAGGIDNVLSQERIVEVIEGLDTTVAIHESLDGQQRFFTVNGKTDGGSGKDMATQLLIGHLPMLLHPQPTDTLVIGLGTGITLTGLSGHPTERIKCVEISAEVVEASHYFRNTHQDVLADPKTTLLINDGRNLLLEDPKTYDVIISEPSNPWQCGNANLFTHDFYQLAATRLKPGGLFAQWIGLYDITPENLQVAVNTLLQTFPEALAFRANSDLIIVAGFDPLKFDYLGIQNRLKNPTISEALQRVGITSAGELIAKHYLSSEMSLVEFSKGSELNTDNLPILEYSGHFLVGEKSAGTLQMDNISALNQFSESVALPLANLGNDLPSIASALRELGEQYQSVGRTNAAKSLLDKARELELQNNRPS
ncbi:MAG: hypothetical protein C0614_11795 [Desulfuromonas sp.]|nr:MAG: hypothetical protein C0614_11795 [Desulfuromonas sp.]